MALIDLILNCFALLLWLNWLALRSDSPAWTPAVSLAGTLRRADAYASKRGKSLASLAALLVGRALVYWQFGSQLHWTPRLDLEIIDLHFHLDLDRTGRRLRLLALRISRGRQGQDDLGEA